MTSDVLFFIRLLFDVNLNKFYISVCDIVMVYLNVEHS